MHLKDLSSDDVLGALGLQTRRTTVDYLLPALGIFGVGVLVGASLGMLFAPKPGAELRHQIGDRVRRRRHPEEEEESLEPDVTPASEAAE